MESGGEDLDNIFEEYESNENEETAENSGNRESTTESAGVRVAPPKRIVKNPRLKFNPERLCGERGIPVLVDHFKSVKFKGKGHEKEDLDRLLGSLEHWTHRLYPSMNFEDCLHHIEKLGRKRLVKTCVRKIRLDMPILNSDFVKDDDEEDNVLRHGDPNPEPPVVDAFDRLIEESQDILNSKTLSVANDENNSIFSSLVSSETRGQVLGSSFASSLTEEQKERMQRNRLLAAERRKAKLTASQMNASDSQSVNNNMSSSQDISSANDDIFKHPNSVDSVQDSTLNNSSLDMETNNYSEARNQNLSVLNNNSENLGLDDLIDLVDNDSTAHHKDIPTEIQEPTDDICRKLKLNNHNKPEETDIFLKETVPINISNSTSDTNLESTVNVPEETDISHTETVPIKISSPDSNMNSTINENVELNKVCENTNEMLDLDSMMDLVDEGEDPDVKPNSSTDSHIKSSNQTFKSFLHNDIAPTNDNTESLQNIETVNSASTIVDD